jgi:hypothetical protein
VFLFFLLGVTVSKYSALNIEFHIPDCMLWYTIQCLFSQYLETHLGFPWLSSHPPFPPRTGNCHCVQSSPLRSLYPPHWQSMGATYTKPDQTNAQQGSHHNPSPPLHHSPQQRQQQQGHLLLVSSLRVLALRKP